MKLKEIFLYELRYQLRNYSTHLIFLALLTISFLIVTGNYVPDALLMDFYINSPFVIASVTTVTTMFWLLIGPSIAGEAAARDIQTGMYPLVYTAPVSKRSYLGGKFLAVLFLNSWIMLSIPLGIILATYTTGIEANLIGPFPLSGFLTAYFYISIPNIFLVSAAQFLLTIVIRRAMASYLAGFGIYIISYVISFSIGDLSISTILDPMSYNYVISTIQRSWTPLDLNYRLITLEGVFFINRLVWFGVGIGLIFTAYYFFKFSYSGSRTERKKKKKEAAFQTNFKGEFGIKALIALQSFGLKSRLLQVYAITSSSLYDILKRKGGFVVLLVVAIFSLAVVYFGMDHQGVPMIAESWRVLIQLTAPLGSLKIPWIFMVILIAFYAGELIWREREARINDVYDATPVSDWIQFSGKFLALAAYVIIFCLLLMSVGIAVQLLMDNYNVNLQLYIKVLFGMQLLDYLIFALLACFVHIVVNQKYIAHFIVLMVFAAIAFAPMLGTTNLLLIPGGDSGWTYTGMQGFSDLKLWALYKLYWTGWAVLLALIGRLLWVRGRNYSLSNRLKIAKGNISRSIKLSFLAGLGVIFMSGGTVYYNTRIQNEFMSAGEQKAHKAEYEKQFSHFRNVPQPVLIKSNLEVDFYPEQRMMEISGKYYFVNHTSVSIDSIHVHEPVEVAGLSFNRETELMLHSKKFSYRIYRLEKPLNPGDSLLMEFDLRHRNDDLSGKNGSKYVVDNGSFFRNYQVLPALGYQFLLELKEKSDREAYNLKPKPEWASLEDKEAPYEMLMWDHRSLVEAVVSTEGNQIAVGPGELIDSWSKGGRTFFKYATNAPIRSEFSFFSADYAVRRDRWKDVDLQIYHHPEHTANLDRMISGMKKSLEYYSEQFGPYPYDQLRLVEHPGSESGLHAGPINIDYYEGFSYMNPAADERDLDFVFAIVGHEVAHQWWGNQLRYARVEGGGLLSESLAWYSAIKMAEDVYGEQAATELLNQLKKEYDIPKSRADVPLIKGNGFFQLYRQGPLALYTISEYIGDTRLNSALRKLFEEHGKGEPPLATSMDLYNEIHSVTPDSLQYLAHDLFLENTFWDLHMEEAAAEKIKDGNWKVTLNIKAQKEVVDEIGNVTEKQMSDWVEIGVYGLPASEDEAGELLYLKKHKLQSGTQKIVLKVPEEPGKVGVDPNYLLDRNPYDNFTDLSNRNSDGLKLN